MEAPLTANEFYFAITKSARNKAPGPDGLPIEYYLTDPHNWARVFEVCYSNQLHRGRMTKFQRRAHLSLLYKAGERLEPGNHRPLTLLNSDAKLGPKIMSYRLGKTLPTILHEDQHGFVPGRSIQQALFEFTSIQQYCKLNDVASAGAVLLDFAKAFDSKTTVELPDRAAKGILAKEWYTVPRTNGGLGLPTLSATTRSLQLNLFFGGLRQIRQHPGKTPKWLNPAITLELSLDRHLLPIFGDIKFRLQHNALGFLYKFAWRHGSTNCVHGCDTPETAIHLFWDCPHAERIWKRYLTPLEFIFGRLGWQDILFTDSIRLKEEFKKQPQDGFFVLLQFVRAICFRQLWLQRNLLLYNEAFPDTLALDAEIQAYMWLHIQAHFKRIDGQDKRKYKRFYDILRRGGDVYKDFLPKQQSQNEVNNSGSPPSQVQDVRP
ncbi:hypothetical protein DYB35_010640 [Aphanomyces astaci]|uniref:Uncharacterized protein n=1 Tax=Aphanomyces astaci TaxID=112090 RepID=A0A3R6WDN1_APHAT|nr:hypothetical protein DYB35_010640 [Aphanomyces astaci]